MLLSRLEITGFKSFPNKTVLEFDDKIADLGAILGKSGSDLDFFKEKSINLGDL